MRSISACAARRSASSGGPNLACGLPPVEPGCVHVRVVRCFDSLHLTRQLVLAALQAIYAHCGVSCAHCRQDVDCRLPIHVGMILPFGCRMQGASPPGRRCPGGLSRSPLGGSGGMQYYLPWGRLPHAVPHPPGEARPARHRRAGQSAGRRRHEHATGNVTSTSRPSTRFRLQPRRRTSRSARTAHLG